MKPVSLDGLAVSGAGGLGGMEVGASSFRVKLFWGLFISWPVGAIRLLSRSLVSRNTSLARAGRQVLSVDLVVALQENDRRVETRADPMGNPVRSKL